MNQLKILIVEDEIITGMMLKKTLISKGFIIIGLETSGEKALEKIKNESPDLILMDIQLAGKLNGIDAVYEIYNFKKIPVIFMTGYPDDDIKDKALALEPVAFLVKPLVTGKLIEIINSINKDGNCIE